MNHVDVFVSIFVRAALQQLLLHNNCAMVSFPGHELLQPVLRALVTVPVECDVVSQVRPLIRDTNALGLDLFGDFLEQTKTSGCSTDGKTIGVLT